MFTEPVRVIDLGVYPDQAAYPPWGYKANDISHAKGARAMAAFLNRKDFEGKEGFVTENDFPESLGLAWTEVHMSDHAGNHIDAPWHFGPTVGGKPAKTIDQIPLEWCMGPGVRLDFRHFSGRDVYVKDLEAELDRIQVEIKPGMIPLIWTGADAYIDDESRYWKHQAGLSLEGLYYFLDRGVRLIAIDAYAMDVSFATQQQKMKDGSQDFLIAHFAGRDREHMHLEKLANLGALPRPSGFQFMAFPIKLRGASAGWVRPAALVPESHFHDRKDG